jgi:NADH:ubiquinone oxidoreductase subunit 6 (subunit J)
MFFILMFLILAATTFFLFPEWSSVMVLLVSLAGAIALRLLLAIMPRSDGGSRKADESPNTDSG